VIRQKFYTGMRMLLWQIYPKLSYLQIIFSIRMPFGNQITKMQMIRLLIIQRSVKGYTMTQFNSHSYDNGKYCIRITLLFGSLDEKTVGRSYRN
jgi:hypothetical protein